MAPAQAANQRRGGMEAHDGDAEHRERVRMDPDQLQGDGGQQIASLRRLVVPAQQQQLQGETDARGQLRPHGQAAFPGEEREREAQPEQRGRLDVAPARRDPEQGKGGAGEEHAKHADADHPAGGMGQGERHLKQPVHIDIRAAREGIGEGIHARPGSVFEHPAAGREVIAEVARGFAAPREQDGERRDGAEDRGAQPRQVLPGSRFRLDASASASGRLRRLTRHGDDAHGSGDRSFHRVSWNEL